MVEILKSQWGIEKTDSRINVDIKDYNKSVVVRVVGN